MAWGNRLLAVMALFTALALLVSACSQSGADENANAPLPQSWFDDYTVAYLSDPVSVRVVGSANARSFPTGRGDTLKGAFKNGEKLYGRWVKGADPNQHWLLTDNGYYVWHGNLAGPLPDPAYATAPPPKKVAEPKVAPAVAEPPSPEARLADLMNDRLDEAAPDSAIAGRVRANAGHVRYDEDGTRSLKWAMCTGDCDGRFQSSLIVQPGRPTLLCIHQEAANGGMAVWYSDRRELRRTTGLCPSSLSAVG